MSKQLCNAHVDHNSDKFSDDLAQESMISLPAVSESSVKKKNSSAVQDIISVLDTGQDWIQKLCQNLEIYHMKKSISAQDIDIISHSIDELILHNFYAFKSVDKERGF